MADNKNKGTDGTDKKEKQDFNVFNDDDFEILDMDQNTVSGDNGKNASDKKDEPKAGEPVPSPQDPVLTAQEQEDFEEDFKKGRVIHIIFLLAVLLIIGIVVVEFMKWNKGVAADYDPTEDTSQYDYESEDLILNLGPTDMAGHVDDGVTTVLCLGDDYFADGKGTDSIPDMIGQGLDNSNVINGSFSGSTLSTIDTGYNPATPGDAFSPYWIVNALNLKDYTIMDYSLGLDALTTKTDDYASTIEALKKVDLSKVDDIVFMYGMNDYLDNRLVTDVTNFSAINSFSGSFQAIITMIQTDYPYIRIIFSGPTTTFATDTSGALVDNSLQKNNYDSLQGYAMAVKAIIADSSYVSYVDNYFGSAINETTYNTYMADSWHLNVAGRKLVADKLISVLDGSYSSN